MGVNVCKRECKVSVANGMFSYQIKLIFFLIANTMIYINQELSILLFKENCERN